MNYRYENGSIAPLAYIEILGAQFITQSLILQLILVSVICITIHLEKSSGPVGHCAKHSKDDPIGALLT